MARAIRRPVLLEQRMPEGLGRPLQLVAWLVLRQGVQLRPGDKIQHPQLPGIDWFVLRVYDRSAQQGKWGASHELTRANRRVHLQQGTSGRLPMLESEKRVRPKPFFSADARRRISEAQKARHRRDREAKAAATAALRRWETDDTLRAALQQPTSADRSGVQPVGELTTAAEL